MMWYFWTNRQSIGTGQKALKYSLFILKIIFVKKDSSIHGAGVIINYLGTKI